MKKYILMVLIFGVTNAYAGIYHEPVGACTSEVGKEISALNLGDYHYPRLVLIKLK